MEAAQAPSAGICLPDNTSTKIYNNIIRNNYNSGINVLGNSTPVIVNNIIAHHRGPANSPGRAIKVIHKAATPITSVKIANNIIYDTDWGLFSQGKKLVTGNSYNNYWQVDEKYFGFTAGSYELFTDPLFVEHYSLNSKSVCIDAGTTASAPAWDINVFFGLRVRKLT